MPLRLRERVVEGLGAREGALGPWAEQTRTAKEEWVTMVTVASRICKLAMATAFSKWKETANLTLRHLAFLQKVSFRVLSLGFDSWRQSVTTVTALRRKMLQVVRVLKNLVLYGAWETWIFRMHERVQKQMMLRWVFAKMQNLRVMHCFERWAFLVEHVAEVERRVKRGSLIILRVRKYYFFHIWREYTSEAAAKKSRGLAAVESMVIRAEEQALRDSFSAWLSCSVHMQHMRNVAAERASRKRELFALGALRAWWDWQRVQQQKRLPNHLGKRFILRWSNWLLSDAFEKWNNMRLDLRRYACDKAGHQHPPAPLGCDVLPLVVLPLEQVGPLLPVRSGMNCYWLENLLVGGLKLYRVLLLERCGMVKANGKHIRFVQTVIQRLRLRMCMRHWLAVRDQCRILRHVQRVVIRRMQQTSLLATFNSWWQMKIDKQRMRMTCSRVLHRLSSCCLAAYFFEWSFTFLQRVRHDREMGRYTGLLETTKEEMVQAQALHNRALAAAKQQELEKLEKLDKVVMKLAGRKLQLIALVWFWNGWKFQWEAKNFIRGILQRLKYDCLHRALNSWNEIAARKRVVLGVARQAARRMIHRYAYMSLEHWFDVARLSATRRRVISIIMKGRVWRFTRHWSYVTGRNRCLKRLSRRVDARNHFWRRRGAFSGWMEVAVLRQALKMSAVRVMQRRRQWMVDGAFSRWYNEAREAREAHKTDTMQRAHEFQLEMKSMEMASLHQQSTDMAGVLQDTHLAVISRFIQRLDTQRRRRRFQLWSSQVKLQQVRWSTQVKLRVRLQRHRRGWVFGAWWELMRGTRRERHLTARLGQWRLLGRLRQWREAVRAKGQLRSQMLAAASACQRTRATRVISFWAAYHSVAARFRFRESKASQMAARRRRAVVVTLWSEWHGSMVASRALRRTEAKVERRRSRSMLSRAWEHWLGSLSETMDEQSMQIHQEYVMRRVASMIFRCDIQRLKEYFLAFLHNATVCQQTRGIMMKVLSRLEKIYKARVVFLWDYHLHKNKLMRRAVNKMIGKSATEALKKIVLAWQVRMQVARQFRAMYQKCMVHSAVAVKRLAFTSWEEFRQQAGVHKGALELAVARMQRLRLWMCFGNWVWRKQRRHGCLLQVRRAVMRMKRARLGEALNQWVNAAFTLKRQARLLLHAAAHLLRFTTTKTFRDWRLHARFRRQLALGRRQFGQQRQRMQITRWREVAHLCLLVTRHKYMALCFRRRLESVGLLACVESWRDRVCVKRVEAAAVQRWQSTCLANVLQTWQELALVRRVRRARTRNLLCRRHLAIQQRAFVLWQERAMFARAKARVLQGAVRRVQRLSLRATWSQWSMCSRLSLSTNRHVLLKAAGKLGRFRKQLALGSWVEVHRFRLQRQVFARRWQLLHSSNLMFKAMGRWRIFHLRHRNARHGERIFRNYLNTAKTRAFYKWAAWSCGNILQDTLGLVHGHMNAVDIGLLALSFSKDPSVASHGREVMDALQGVTEAVCGGTSAMALVRRHRLLQAGRQAMQAAANVTSAAGVMMSPPRNVNLGDDPLLSSLHTSASPRAPMEVQAPFLPFDFPPAPHEEVSTARHRSPSPARSHSLSPHPLSPVKASPAHHSFLQEEEARAEIAATLTEWATDTRSSGFAEAAAAQLAEEASLQHQHQLLLDHADAMTDLRQKMRQAQAELYSKEHELQGIKRKLGSRQNRTAAETEALQQQMAHLSTTIRSLEGLVSRATSCLSNESPDGSTANMQHVLGAIHELGHYLRRSNVPVDEVNENLSHNSVDVALANAMDEKSSAIFLTSNLEERSPSQSTR
ncbi:hypothetical protein CYMTET_14226 [Cymbomonas tetramitiformis]|uniref:Sfi1 spindle body domain-containing protein n=1 Tax=Cymbomonas tetramitiformis TaxID=36881 RepID=A0AAE0GGU5_9CHLO|nr:hypothetical protein CYMTET_14226 [Cymbomonas tetramitiformis]